MPATYTNKDKSKLASAGVFDTGTFDRAIFDDTDGKWEATEKSADPTYTNKDKSAD